MLAGVLGTAFLAACASTGQRVVVPWRAGNATSLQMGTVEEHRAQAAHGVLPITLYRPTGAGPFPFVVLLHGCGGLKHDAIWTQWVQPWAALFHDYGIGTAVVDSFGPRGVAHVCTGDVAAWAVRRADVAYSSRVWLAEHPDVDAVFEGMWGRCPGCCKSVAEQKHRANGFQHRLVQGLRASLTPVTLVLPSETSAMGQAHRITSSAWKRMRGGIVRPRALAVLRLITSSNFVGCSTGSLAGLAPLRILST